ncbi:biotin/lipoyl-containing protein [Acidobacteriota bacterium]
MRYQVTTGGTTFDIRIEQKLSKINVFVNGNKADLDFVECADGVLSAILGGKSYDVSLDSGGNGHYKVHWQGNTINAAVERGTPNAVSQSHKASRPTGEIRIETPMPGKIVAVLVEVGQRVKKGQGLVVVEAMKMENEFSAPRPGTIKSISVSPGDKVESHAILAVVEEES